MNQKRFIRLFQEFAAKGDLSHLFTEYFAWETLKSMEPRRLVVVLKVKFNYNFRTFLLTEPPTLGTQTLCAEQINSVYDEAKEMKLSHPNSREIERAAVVAYIGRDHDTNRKALS
jgi:hypothetical protein